MGRITPAISDLAAVSPDDAIIFCPANHNPIGVPSLNEMLSLVMKYPNVFIDTSAYKVNGYPSELVEYMRGDKRHRVLFGSNHPFWPAGECIAELDHLNLGVEAQSAFLADNARRLFKLA